MDGVIDSFSSMPRPQRLDESLMLCEDLLCLAEHRLPTAQGGDKEMWEAIKERCEHHLPLLRAVDAAGTSTDDIDAAVKAFNTEKVLQEYCRHIRDGGEFCVQPGTTPQQRRVKECLYWCTDARFWSRRQLPGARGYDKDMLERVKERAEHHRPFMRLAYMGGLYPAVAMLMDTFAVMSPDFVLEIWDSDEELPKLQVEFADYQKQFSSKVSGGPSGILQILTSVLSDIKIPY